MTARIINRLPWCAHKRVGGLVFISVGRAPARQSIDDATRDAWVQDHAGWYAALCRSGLPRMAFVRLHAADIDADIRVASQARGRRMGGR